MKGQPRSQRQWAVGLFIFFLILGVGYAVWLSANGSPSDATAVSPGTDPDVLNPPTRTPRPTRTARPTRTPLPTSTLTPAPLKVGIVAGHWKNDSGAVCDDGLKEVDINLDVAARVVALLEQQGYHAELLPEFSEELNGYMADAFVSIHTDSCAVPDRSGFKVARVASSAIPQQEDRLVACLSEMYASATGLAFDSRTITFDMTEYHAFREIAPATPGAIIELGFMDADRRLLTNHSDRVAKGVAQGIICFLEGQ